MVVIHYTAVGANGNINTGFLKIFVPCLANLDKSGSLSSAYALCLPCNADRASAYTDLYKIRSAVCKKSEAVGVNDIACADFYGLAVILSYPFDCELLPLGKSLRRINTEHICACLSNNSLGFCLWES